MAKTSHEYLRNMRIPHALAMLVSGMCPVYAQQPPGAGAILETVKERGAPLKPSPGIVVPAETRPALKAQPGLKVSVTAFRITGSTVFSEESLLALVADQVGNELDFDGLNQAAEKIAMHYRSKGYFLAQAYLPRQKIMDGIVEIAVLEGRVGEVKLIMSKDARLKESRARDLLGAIQSGDLINEEHIERGLLLLNDTPGVVVRTTLEPGASVGAADAVVELGDDGKPFTGSLELDNWGNRYTGEYRLGANVNFNNPSGYGDLLSVRALTSNSGGTPMGRLSYVFPAGSSGTRLGAGYSRMQYTLGKDFVNLHAHGEANVTSVYALHPFIRTRNLNIFGLLGMDSKILKDFVDSTNSRDNRDLRIYKAGASGDFRDDVVGGGLNSFSLVASGGKVTISDPAVNAIDQSAVGYKTAGTFNKFNYEYQRVQALQAGTSLFVSLSGQKASKNLVSAEKFSLGGPNGVRAYPVGEAAADEGLLLNAELRWNIPQTDLMVDGFIDGGRARLNHAPLPVDIVNNRTISAYGLGLNMGKQGSYLLRTSLAWRGGNATPQADSKNSNPRAWIQITNSF